MIWTAFNGTVAEQALLAALDDNDELVRGQATATLMQHSGLTAYAGTPARASVFEQEAPWSEDLDLNSLNQLRGGERDWAQHLIYLQLPEGAVRALLHVGDPGGGAALREVAAMEDSEIADAADQIIL